MNPQDNTQEARETGVGARGTSQGTLPHTEAGSDAVAAQDSLEALASAALVLDALQTMQKALNVVLEQLPRLMKRRT